MRRAVILACIALLAASCGGGTIRTSDSQPPTTTMSEDGQIEALASARSQWNDAAPSDYTLTEVNRCDGCAAEPQTVAVRNGEVVSLASGEATTVEDVFGTIEESIHGGAIVEVEYDPDLGYPRRVVIDLDGDGTSDIDIGFSDLTEMPIVASLEELRAARRRWEAAGLESYRYIFRAECTCDDGGTVQVEVQAGQVTNLVPLDAGGQTTTLNPGPLDSAFADLEAWFIDATDLIAEGLLSVDVRVDPTYGYPRWFEITAAGIDDDRFAEEFTLVVTQDLIAGDPAEIAQDPRLDDRADLVAAGRRWAAAGLTDYRYVLTVHCECDVETSGPFEITVRNGRVVTSVRRADGGEAMVGAASIAEIFDVIEARIGAGTDVDIVYDATFGYPVEVIIDPEAVAVDGGLAFSITEFAADR
jgi:hypothetical protein